MSGWPWSHLDLRETSDKTAIRRAYASKLKQLDVDQDIAGYAQLRDARDYALHLAATMAQDDASGVGLLDDDSDILVDTLPDTQDGSDDGAPADEADDDDFWNIDADIGPDPANNADSGRRDGPEPQPATEVDLEAQNAWLALQRLIFPNSEYTETGFTVEEYEQARAHLTLLLNRAEHCDVVEHDALDHGLSELLAQGWPRSAPLAKQANDAFHWSDQAGHIGERPALQFLNPRVAESLFHEEIQREGHRLHPAWVELTSPGGAGLFKGFRIRKGAVLELLMLVRTHYPGLEWHFDAQRVASWDKPPQTWWGWFWSKLLYLIIILYGVGGIANLISGGSDEAAPPPPVVVSENVDGATQDAIARTLFGDEMTMEEVMRRDAAFGSRLKTAINTNDRNPQNAAREVLRQDMLRAREHGDAGTIVAISREYLGWMKAMNARGGDSCSKAQLWQFGDVDVDAGALAAEQSLAARLLREGQLGKAVPSEAFQDRAVGITDAVGAEALRISGLSPERFNAAIKDSNHPDRCRMTAALLEAAIHTPGDAPVDLLRIL